MVRNRRVGLMLGVGVVAMLGLAYASVPLYKLFCQVTGYGGTPKIGAFVEKATGAAAGRIMTVMLDANVNKDLKWDFASPVNTMRVHLGEEVLAIYTARNYGNVAVTGTATFNVTPFKAAEYITKIDCFCFTEQRLEAGQEMPMPVSFYIDPEIMNDPNTKDLENIVLSYTFFPSRKTAAMKTGDDKG
ncbi:MAG: cytochrome c oxidase assembly protein [Rhodospirillales bacterium]|nr:cytochrome c oxidase assembly protein [Rhodospirillales bacterium]